MFDICSPFIQSYYFVLPNAHKSILQILSIQFHCFWITLSILNEFSLTKITITLNVLNLGNFWSQFFNNFSIPGWAGGRVRGCQPRHKWVWGGCVTLFQKLLNQKALVKRFPFLVFMTNRISIYQNKHMAPLVYFSE